MHQDPSRAELLLAVRQATAVLAAALDRLLSPDMVDDPPPHLSLVPTPAASPMIDGESPDARRKRLARERQQARREKVRGVTPSRFPVTPVRDAVTHVDSEKPVGEQGRAPLTCGKPAENGTMNEPEDSTTVDGASRTERDSVTPVAPLSRGFTASSAPSPAAALLSCSATSSPSPSSHSRAHERDARSTKAESSPPPDDDGKRDRKDVWAAVQACGRAHAAVLGHGSATFADMLVRYPKDDCAQCGGGPCRVPASERRPTVLWHKHRVYDVCLYLLSAAHRALVEAGQPAALDTRIRVVALAYRSFAEGQGLFMEWKASLQADGATSRAMSAAVKAWMRQRAPQGAETSTKADSQPVADSPEEKARKLADIERLFKGGGSR